MTRIQRVIGYWRKYPDRPDAFEAIHAELAEARERDRILDAGTFLLVKELERELQREGEQ